MTTTPGEPVNDLDIDATGISNESVAASEGTASEGTGSEGTGSDAAGDDQRPADAGDAGDA